MLFNRVYSTPPPPTKKKKKNAKGQKEKSSKFITTFFFSPHFTDNSKGRIVCDQYSNSTTHLHNKIKITYHRLPNDKHKK